jgi:hypothetical protein
MHRPTFPWNWHRSLKADRLVRHAANIALWPWEVEPFQRQGGEQGRYAPKPTGCSDPDLRVGAGRLATAGKPTGRRGALGDRVLSGTECTARERRARRASTVATLWRVQGRQGGGPIYVELQDGADSSECRTVWTGLMGNGLSAKVSQFLSWLRFAISSVTGACLWEKSGQIRCRNQGKPRPAGWGVLPAIRTGYRRGKT